MKDGKTRRQGRGRLRRRAELGEALARICRLDEGFARTAGGRLDAISEQELLAAREALHRGHKPEEEAVMRLERRPCRRSPRPSGAAPDERTDASTKEPNRAKK